MRLVSIPPTPSGRLNRPGQVQLSEDESRSLKLQRHGSGVDDQCGVLAGVDGPAHGPPAEALRTAAQKALPFLAWIPAVVATPTRVVAMAGPKYSKEQKERFFDLVDRDGTVMAAAKAVGVHEAAAYTWLRYPGLSMQRATPRKYSEAEKAEFFRRLAENPNVSAIAREMGFTRVTCYAWAYKAGIRSSEARKINPRREEFLRLRAEGLTRAEKPVARRTGLPDSVEGRLHEQDERRRIRGVPVPCA